MALVLAAAALRAAGAGGGAAVRAAGRPRGLQVRRGSGGKRGEPPGNFGDGIGAGVGGGGWGEKGSARVRAGGAGPVTSSRTGSVREGALLDRGAWLWERVTSSPALR